MIKKVKGGVTKAMGFEAASCAAGLKYEGRDDMALVYSKVMCRAAGTFTTNIVKAAPVKWDQNVIETYGSAQAVVVNSGIANACTGEEGMECCSKTAKAAAETLGIREEEVLIGSTGVIGKQMPITKLTEGITQLAQNKNNSLENGTRAAMAIKTTDTYEKEIAVEFEISGVKVTLGGMAKGSGMIHPNMCTMLAFLTTDAKISSKALQKALSEDIKDTYNMISVDGDTSTNDTVLLLANGMAKNPEIQENTPEYDLFKEALHTVNEYLAKKIAGDGEGATALFEVEVTGAKTKEQAQKLAKSIVCSNLTKTAIAGHDANWGRILCAMGYAGVEFDPEKVDLYFESTAGHIQIIEKGVAVNYSEEEATKILSKKEVRAIAHLHLGGEKGVAWGCDLTHGYIEINADYRS